MLQMEVLKETYESRMNEIVSNRKSELMDQARFYMEKIEFQKSQLRTDVEIQDKLIARNQQLMTEVRTLQKIVKTGRLHFKELEKADFNELQTQMNKFDEIVKKMNVTEDQIKRFRAMRATIRIQENEEEKQRRDYNQRAKKHKF